MARLLLQLAYSNLWIALQAVGQTCVNMLLLGVRSYEACWLAGLSMFFVYTFAKTVRFDPQADWENDPQRMEFLQRWRWPLVALASFGFLHGLWLTRGDAGRAWLFVFALVGAVFYDVKWLPATYRYRRLKDITGVKSLVVALIWGVQTTWLPVYDAGMQVAWGPLLGVTLYASLCMFINTVYFDVGDIKGDRLEGVVTLPLWLGFHNTVRMLHAVNLFCMVWLAWMQWMGWVNWLALPLQALTLYTWWFLRAARDEDSDLSFWCDVIVDGAYVFIGLWIAGVALLTGQL